MQEFVAQEEKCISYKMFLSLWTKVGRGRFCSLEHTSHGEEEIQNNFQGKTLLFMLVRGKFGDFNC